MTNAVTITAPEGLPFVDIEREFDAPPAAVFRAHADPELVSQWMGPHGYEMTLPEWDFTSHGSYRFIHRDTEGNEYCFNGTFHTVRENEMVIQTFEFEGAPDAVSIEKLTLTDLGNGRTKLSSRATYPSVEVRDAMVESGMEYGITEGYESLDEVLAGWKN
ncbi:SRPBCC family protein [Paramicrobacterium chengjingii]|uniref:SRPBCC family protein n=1 Tax=Paramicrobacterium chengjingii TaxID=2769067 RepID=UPI00141ED9F2|nr:SRPBCC family protein [Microbacterium chengjingii]